MIVLVWKGTTSGQFLDSCQVNRANFVCLAHLLKAEQIDGKGGGLGGGRR